MEDWVIVRADAHDRLLLLIEAPTGKRGNWVEVPRLPLPFKPVVKWIRLMAGHGLMSMMVLFDFLLRRITPLQMHFHPAWQYTRGVTPRGLSAVMAQV
jgi:hypothetical protein